MAYKVLFRKYRPQNFDEIVGQQHIVKTLKNEINNNKIAHAYLFCGPRGTGKTSMAKIFSKALNCTATDIICNNCDNCISVNENNHPDVVEIDAASNNGVEEVRNLIEKVKYSPIKGKYKVYIIDEVHMMTTSAFNALLKTLEEPPSNVIFILATTEPYKILPTIISRCQRFDFSKLSNEEIKEGLVKVLEQENISYDEKVVEEIAKLSDGALRDALSITQQLLSYTDNKLTIDDLYQIYRLISKEQKLDFLTNIYNNENLRVVEKIRDIIDEGYDLKRLTMDFVDIIKECLFYFFTNDEKILKILTIDEAKELMSQTNEKELFKDLDNLMMAIDNYSYTTDINNHFELCILKLLKNNSSAISKKVAIEEKKEIINEIKKEVEVPKKEIETKKMVEENNDDYLLSLLKRASKDYRNIYHEKWSLVDNYCWDERFKVCANQLKNIALFGCGADYIIVVCPYPEYLTYFNDEDNQKLVINFMNQIIGHKVKLFAITSNDRDRLLIKFKEQSVTNQLKSAPKIDFSNYEDGANDPVIDFFEGNVEVKE
ncbi:MAG: DNA polymerase III subunit gamma/tau [Erysipelotrichaceae bacterium]